MVDHVRLLPSNATPLELALAEVNDPFAGLGDSFNSISAADYAPPPDFLPFLVWQYGLGELSPYVPNLFNLIRDGLRWQRVRGTPAALALGLGFVGYSGALEEEPTRRLRWNRFQIALDRIRDSETDLDRINGIADLSPPVRSQFFRGFAGYDVRAAETSYGKTSATLLSNYSGVRLRADGAKWSFGRQYDLPVQMSQSALTALGVWLDPIPDTTGGPWAAMHRPWLAEHVAWSLPSARARRITILTGVYGSPRRTVYVKLKNAAGGVIGYARAITQLVSVDSGGVYSVGGDRYKVDAATPERLLVSALTGFGDGFGSTATTASVVFDPTFAPTTKPGALWVPSGGLSGGIEDAQTTISISFGQTVRERINFLLRV